MVTSPLPQNNANAELFWADDHTLGVRWADGHEARYPLETLRKHCPCALCRATRQQGLVLHRQAQKPPRALRALEVLPVGRYAIQIVWNDGHRTGIYTYASLHDGFPA